MKKKSKKIKTVEDFKETYFPNSTYEELLRRVQLLEIEIALLKARPIPFGVPYNPWGPSFWYYNTPTVGANTKVQNDKR